MTTRLRPRGRVWSLYVVVGVVAILFSSLLATVIPLSVRTQMDVWFGSDIPRVISNISIPLSYQGRTSVHPIVPLLLLPVVRPVM